MNAQQNLARLRFEDPQAAAAAVDALWSQLAREDPRMFAALWRRANRDSRRPADVVTVPAVQWLDEMPPMEVTSQRLPAVDRSPAPVMVQPSPSLLAAAELEAVS
jgi:hypothetical protein